MSVLSSAPLSTSHSLMVLSPLPLASVLPAGLKATRKRLRKGAQPAVYIYLPRNSYSVSMSNSFVDYLVGAGIENFMESMGFLPSKYLKHQ